MLVNEHIFQARIFFSSVFFQLRKYYQAARSFLSCLDFDYREIKMYLTIRLLILMGNPRQWPCLTGQQSPSEISEQRVEHVCQVCPQRLAPK